MQCVLWLAPGGVSGIQGAAPSCKSNTPANQPMGARRALPWQSGTCNVQVPTGWDAFAARRTGACLQRTAPSSCCLGFERTPQYSQSNSLTVRTAARQASLARTRPGAWPGVARASGVERCQSQQACITSRLTLVPGCQGLCDDPRFTDNKGHAHAVASDSHCHAAPCLPCLAAAIKQTALVRTAQPTTTRGQLLHQTSCNASPLLSTPVTSCAPRHPLPSRRSPTMSHVWTQTPPPPARSAQAPVAAALPWPSSAVPSGRETR